jgi:hypothetical protein
VTVVDTSDWQRGTVAPQKLIGNFGAASNPETVTLPANAETLWVFCVGVVGMILQSVVGVTTGKPYPFAAMPLLFGAGANPIYVVPVSSAADMQVTITWAAAPAQWYVVADAGVRLVIDQVLQAILATGGLASPGIGLEMLGTDGTNARVIAVSQQGIAYAIPSAPDTATGDHPPNELLWATNTTAGSTTGTILPLPGVGKRYRLFYVELFASPAPTATTWIEATVNGNLFIVSGLITPASLDRAVLPLSGMPLDANTKIGLLAPVAVTYVVGYTLETV